MTQTTKNSAKPAIELMPPSVLLRVGRRRLTLTWRPRLRLPSLLSGLLRRSWKRVLAPTLKVSIAAAAVCGAWQMPALAAAPAPGTLPAGWSVVNGNITFTQNGNTLNINQLSPQAIANFVSFSIGSDATVNVNQPGSLAALLARVTGGDISQIYGKLTAPGTVVLYNPNGLVIGPGGMVDVGRFVGTTLNISDSDFLAGKFNFVRQGMAGAVDNQGTIQSATGGSVYLVGSSVSNSGVIKSAGGEVILGAGDTVTLADTATPGVTVKVTGSAGSVTNLGTITADAGRIGVAAGLINNSGVISASSAVKEGGRIFLRASQSLKTTATSSISADGTTGGNVVLYSDNKAFIDGDVSATGSAGNGGFVETSGLQQLDVIKAPVLGSGGTWYIDPYDLEVVSDINILQNANYVGGVVTSTGNSAQISNGTINNLLNTNVSVTLATGNGGAQAGNLAVNADIIKNAGLTTTLTLNAHNNISINASIVNTSTSGALNLDARTNYQGTNSAATGVTLGAGTIRLGGTSGGGGTFSVSTGTGTSGNGNLTVANGGTLDLTVNSGAYGVGTTLVAGNVSIAAGGNISAQVFANVTVGGTLTNGGIFSLGNSKLDATTFNTTSTGVSTLSNVSGAVPTINNSGSLTIRNNFLALTNSLTRNLAGGSLTFDGGVGGFGHGAVTNAGTMSFQNVMNFEATSLSNTGAGVMNIANSTLAVTQYDNLGGTTNLTQGSQLTGAVTNAANASLNIDGSAGQIILASAVTNNGTMTVKGAVATNGAVTNAASGIINLGSADLSSAITGSAWENNGNVTLAGGSNTVVMTNAFSNSGTTTVGAGTSLTTGGEFINTGKVVLNGGGQVGANSISNNAGATISGNGTINVDTTLQNDGTVSPGGDGKVGSMTIVGNYSQSASGKLLIDIDDTSSDQITFNSSTVSLGGTLQTQLVGVNTPSIGTSYSPFNFVGGIGSLQGSYFRNVTGDIRTVGGVQQMFKATYGDTNGGVRLTMLGAAQITAVQGDYGWGSLEMWGSTGYIPTEIDTVVINNGVTVYHGDGNDKLAGLIVNNGGSLSVADGSLSVATSTVLDGQVDVSGGTASLALNGLTSGSGSLNVGSEMAPLVAVSGPSATLANVQSGLNVAVRSGSLSYTGAMRVAGLNVSGGTVTGAAGSRLNVSENFVQSGGALNLADAALSNTGALQVGNITADNLVLESQSSTVSQLGDTTVHAKTQLIASAVSGIDLSSEGNQIAAFAANNSGQGDIRLNNFLNSTDTSAVILNGVSTATGNILIDNTGAMQTAAIGSKADFLANLPTLNANTAAAKLAMLGINTTGQLKTVTGDVTVATHSPLTIGSGGVNAGGNIALTAGAAGDPTSNLVINGVLSGANINLTAGMNLAVNANVVATGAYTPLAPSGTVTYAPGVSYSQFGNPAVIPNPKKPDATTTDLTQQGLVQQQKQQEQAQNLQNTVAAVQLGKVSGSSGDVQQSGGGSSQGSGSGASFGEEGESKAPASKRNFCS